MSEFRDYSLLTSREEAPPGFDPILWGTMRDLEQRHAIKLVRELAKMGFKGKVKSRSTGTKVVFLPKDEMEAYFDKYETPENDEIK